MNFFDSYDKLKKSIPIPSVQITNLESCDLVDYTHHSKNCYQTFVVLNSERCMYVDDCGMNKDVEMINLLQSGSNFGEVHLQIYPHTMQFLFFTIDITVTTPLSLLAQPLISQVQKLTSVGKGFDGLVRITM